MEKRSWSAVTPTAPAGTPAGSSSSHRPSSDPRETNDRRTSPRGPVPGRPVSPRSHAVGGGTHHRGFSRNIFKQITTATSAATSAAVSVASSGSHTTPGMTFLLDSQTKMDTNQNRILWFLHNFPRVIFQSAETQRYLVAKSSKKKKKNSQMMVWKGKAASMELRATLQYKSANDAVNETHDSFEPEWNPEMDQVAFRLKKKCWTVSDDSLVRLMAHTSSFDRRWFEMTFHGDFFSLRCPVSNCYLGVNVDDHILECRQPAVSTSELLRLCVKGGIRSKASGRFLTVKPESVQAPCTASVPGALETLLIEIGAVNCRIYSCAGVSQRQYRRYMSCWKDNNIEGTWHLGFPLHGHSQSDMGSFIEEQFEIFYAHGNYFTIRACNDHYVRWDGSRLSATSLTVDDSTLFEIVAFHKTRRTSSSTTPQRNGTAASASPPPTLMSASLTDLPSVPRPPVPPRTATSPRMAKTEVSLPSAPSDDQISSSLDSLSDDHEDVRAHYRRGVASLRADERKKEEIPFDGNFTARSGLSSAQYAQDELIFKEEIVCVLPDLCDAACTQRVVGTLFITNYRLFYVPDDDFLREECQWSIPLGSLEQINPQGLLEDTWRYTFEIFAKHWIQPETSRRKLMPGYHLLCTSPVEYGGVEDPARVLELIQKIAFPVQSPLPLPTQYFAFTHRSNLLKDDGWALYSVEREFDRQIRQYNQQQRRWTVFEGNREFAICPSYPELMVQPYGATEQEIAAIALHRSKKRVPAVTWIHPTNGAAMLRCSQPMQGFRSSKSSVEEKYFSLICSPNNPVIWIMDARPQINAMANRLKGAGYEDKEHYKAEDYTVKIRFLGIGNIHVMRESLKRLRKLCQAESAHSNVQYIVANSCWYEHIGLVLRSAVRCAEKVQHEGQTVVLHCSDGWDRTAQLSSLGQILMDGYFRTVRGFCILIEKDWLSFGHKFADRLGQGDGDTKNKERSPIFLQFVDCVWQLLHQFPTHFEFNEWFLLAVMEHTTSNRFGTFLYNTQQMREEFEVRGKTHSLWNILINRPNYINLSYDGSTGSEYLDVRTEPADLALWKLYYLPPPI